MAAQQSTIQSVAGLREELDARATSGVGLVSGRVVVTDADGHFISAIGSPGNCIQVDGTTVSCSATQVDNDTITGVMNGVNALFTVSQAPSPPSSLQLFRNGILQKVSVDYTLSGNTITFINGTAPTADDILQVYYRAPSQAGTRSARETIRLTTQGRTSPIGFTRDMLERAPGLLTVRSPSSLLVSTELNSVEPSRIYTDQSARISTSIPVGQTAFPPLLPHSSSLSPHAGAQDLQISPPPRPSSPQPGNNVFIHTPQSQESSNAQERRSPTMVSGTSGGPTPPGLSPPIWPASPHEPLKGEHALQGSPVSRPNSPLPSNVSSLPSDSLSSLKLLGARLTESQSSVNVKSYKLEGEVSPVEVTAKGKAQGIRRDEICTEERLASLRELRNRIKCK